MPPVRPRFAAVRGATLLLGVVVCVVLAAPYANARPNPPLAASAGSTATSIGEFGSVPSEVSVGAPAAFAWEALDAHGDRVVTFSAAADLSVSESGIDANAPAWVNSSSAGPLTRAANGTFSIPASAWTGGLLGLSIDLAVSGPITVRLYGPLLPTVAGPIALTALPDLNHLVLYGATNVTNHLANQSRSYSAYWHVKDRFGDPAPGARLLIEFSTGTAENETVVPVLWSTGGTTGAWVNYSVNGSAGGTLTVVDEAGVALLGPMTVPAVGTGSTTSAPSLSPLALAGVTLLAVGGIGGIGALLYGGRPRRSPAPTGEEEELRRLAEGRATVVELLRRSGPLALPEIEARWEPPPAPPALADWIASLVTDGTLSATIDEGGRARFALAERPTAEPHVTLDEEALERGIARREAAVARDDEDRAGSDQPKA